MIIIPVKEGENIDRALKRFKRKFEKTGIMKEIRERQQYTKKCEKRRQVLIRAAYIQKLKQQAELG
ncbi:MAG TPA: 30S ribosomal protein S21 [Salinivirgaceae bacterium]|nr:30S ribosomal protein S21 [Salinivirgaceae bacterium]